MSSLGDHKEIGDVSNCKNSISGNAFDEQNHTILCTPVPLRQSVTTINSETSGNNRSTWSRQLDFFLSCVGYAVGLGNIWRFPYLCYESGGGAFLIPYFFFLLVCGVPLFYLEMSLGQFGSLGPIAIWRISPIFKGLGYGMAIVSAMVCIYYNVIIAYALYYVYQSYSVPWSSCGNVWNTPNCVSRNDAHLESTIFNSSETVLKDSIYGNSSNVTSDMFITYSNFTSHNQSRRTASEEFWIFKVLHQSSGIESVGEPQWSLVLTLFIAWALVFFCVLKGIKSSGKVVYVTATFPYIVLVCLLVRGITLPGAWEGILFYLSPQWKKLLTFKVWGDAATQIFYSVGAGWGALLTMASYNKFSHNVYRDSIVVPIINCGTSILAGFVVFSVIGYMAHETGKSIESVVSYGPGLVFIIYPQAISLLPVPTVWAFLFFLMLLAVGLDTQFGMFETAVSAFLDEYPQLLRKRKTSFAAFLCILLFILGLPCVTQGGIYVLQLLDWYCAAFSLMVISLLETIAVAWIYGIDRFILDISLMTKKVPSIWWRLCWCYITPLTIMGLLIFICVTHTSISYKEYTYPSWSVGIGWFIALCSIVPIPLFAIWKILKSSGTLKERLIFNLQPSEDWGPALAEHRILYRKSLNNVPTRFMQFPVKADIDAVNVNENNSEEMTEMLPVQKDSCV